MVAEARAKRAKSVSHTDEHGFVWPRKNSKAAKPGGSRGLPRRKQVKAGDEAPINIRLPPFDSSFQLLEFCHFPNIDADWFPAHTRLVLNNGFQYELPRTRHHRRPRQTHRRTQRTQTEGSQACVMQCKHAIQPVACPRRAVRSCSAKSIGNQMI